MNRLLGMAKKGDDELVPEAEVPCPREVSIHVGETPFESGPIVGKP